MDKYGVTLDDEKTKTAGTTKTCPSCGSKLTSENPPLCPKCGTKPFEKQPKK